MKKITLFIIALISLSIYGQKNECPVKKDKNYKCGNIVENVFEGISNNNYQLQTKFNITVNQKFKRKIDRKRAEKIITLVNKVMNDSDFWKALSYYKNYKYSKWSNRLNDDWLNISGEEIVNALINGDPKNKNRPDEINLELEVRLYGLSFATPFETAVAKEENGIVYNKRWFFRKDSISNIGSNWVHEIAHSKGIRHCFNCNQERDYSIPYVINRIFKQVAKKYL